MLISCSLFSPKQVGPPSEKGRSTQITNMALYQRVKGLMDMKADGLWGQIVRFYDPDYAVQAPKGDYARKVKIKDPQILRIISVGPNEARVDVLFSIEISGRQYPGVTERQVWVRKQGIWYYRPERPRK